MPIGSDLILDGTCETYLSLKSYAVDTFYDFGPYNVENKDAIYVIGRMQFLKNTVKIRDLIESGVRIVYSNPFEGSETIRNHLIRLGFEDIALAKKLLIISGGDLEPGWPYMLYDHFLPKVHNFTENLEQCARVEEIYSVDPKPYKFLFLNGRARSHRKWLVERFAHTGVLDSSIWSLLDPNGGISRGLQLTVDGEDLMSRGRPVRLLDSKYEVDRYHDHLSITTTEFAKYKLFNNEWGDIYLKAEPYIDTYFSVVTETVFEYPYSFRTEKIWKPIAIGHPWIVAANYGYYRDLRKLGFKTFDHLIDESFDLIENNNDRIVRIAETVEDLCKSGASEFLQAAKDICKYNQQHLWTIRGPVQQEFTGNFFNFLKDNKWMI